MNGKKIYSIYDFGAEPDTGCFQHEHIQRAIDTCFQNGGGEVIIPSGKYLVGGIRIRSGVTLHLLENSILEASRNPEDYFILKSDQLEPVSPEDLDEGKWERKNGAPKAVNIFGSRWHNAILRAYNAENFAIIGEKGSVIDGKDCYDDFGEEFYRGPHGISILGCRNFILKGYTIQNTGNWAHEILNSSDMRFEDLTIYGGHDGIHPRSCENITIRSCKIHTGDDCIAGFNNKNVLVEDCTLNTACSAFRFAGNNVLIHNCHAYAPAKHLFRGSLTQEEKISGIIANCEAVKNNHRYNMLSFFTYLADLSIEITHQASNIVIRDCTAKNADRFFHFNYSGNEIWQNNKPLLDIKFENIKAIGIKLPLTAYGDAQNPVSLEIENAEFEFSSDGQSSAFMYICNYKQIKLKDIKITGTSGDALIRSWSISEQGEITLDNVSAVPSPRRLIAYTDTEFSCKPI